MVPANRKQRDPQNFGTGKCPYKCCISATVQAIRQKEMHTFEGETFMHVRQLTWRLTDALISQTGPSRGAIDMISSLSDTAVSPYYP